jgi:hypothetical protein
LIHSGSHQSLFLPFDPAIRPAGFEYPDNHGEVLSGLEYVPHAAAHISKKGVVLPRQRDLQFFLSAFMTFAVKASSLRRQP